MSGGLAEKLVAKHNVFKKNGGYFEFPKGILKISGPDARDFLHRMTSQNVNALSAGAGVPAALLQPNASIISLFHLYNSGSFFLVVSDEGLLRATHEALEKFHFAENLEMKDISGEFRFLSVQGPGAKDVVAVILGRIPPGRHEIIGTEDALVLSENDFSAPTGFHLLIKTSRFSDVIGKLESRGLGPMSSDLWNLLRAEAGHATFGVDMSDKNLILEGALADYVSRDKGCYPGQEVVERIFTYGNVAKKLVGVEWPTNAAVQDGSFLAGLAVPGKLIGDEGKEVGTLTSVKFFPWSKRAFGFAMVRKPFYEEGQHLRVAGTDADVRVVSLPRSFEIRRELS